MQYIVTDGGVQLFDDDYKPIELDAALVAVQRVSAGIEAMYARFNTDAAITVDTGAQATSAGAMAARLES